MRSLLFVPGDSERKLEKGLQSGADALIVDLEDSVSGANKPAARELTAKFLAERKENGPILLVRVNDLSTGLTDDDLAAVMSAAPNAIMLPKCSGLNDVEHLSAKLRVHEANHGLPDRATGILPIITETGASVLNGHSYTPQSRLIGVTWGAEDLSAEVGASATRRPDGEYTDVFRLARAVTILAGSAAQVAAIDTVFPNFRDEDAFRRDCENAIRDGFTGRMAIHPAQVPVINDVFTPSDAAIAHARAVVDAFAAAGNPGVVGIDGEMYDRPHLKRAERLLERARAAGLG
ncbi:HpcH/HpaI aldolase/citrate lyase family protein [Aliihoeflea sp. PC F10.4]